MGTCGKYIKVMTFYKGKLEIFEYKSKDKNIFKVVGFIDLKSKIYELLEKDGLLEINKNK